LEESNKREQGYVGVGGRYTIKQFKEKIAEPEYLAREAIRIANINLQAIEAPSGEQTVVLGPGWPGILLHEAIGHGLEGDFIRKQTSAFSGLLDTKVASELVTVIDDGALAGERGSLNIDDEGFQGLQTVLIENGRLVNFMQDQLNAGLMGAEQTGNARRESYAYPPMPRMTNTYMMGGESDPKEIIATVNEGIYAPGFSGGQVDITSGKFVFSASEAYLIQGGKIGPPIRGAMLIGDGPDVLKQVSMVGNDFELAPGIGICGKDGQSVPVGVGQPTVKIDMLTVGGTGLA
jgi:TldD protein